MESDYQEIGKILQDAREKLGLTLEDISSATKIQVRYLQAIENGQVDRLPGPFYVKAFIRQYANTVNLDPNTILDTKAVDDSSDDQQQDDLPNKSELKNPFIEDDDSDSNNDKKISNGPVRVGTDGIPRAGMNISFPFYKKILARLPIIITIVVVLAAVFVVWSLSSSFRFPGASYTSISSSSASVSQKRSSASRSSRSSSSSSSSSRIALSAPTFQGNLSSMSFDDQTAHTIQISTAGGPSWVTIDIDNIRQFSGTLPAGSSQTFNLDPNQQRFAIHIGNPARTTISFDGHDAGYSNGSNVLITNVIISRGQGGQ